MRRLLIRCQFVAHSYQGIRLTNNRREELDWPPAPGRLFQGLLSVALSGMTADSPEAGSYLDALRWFECLEAPVIEASKLEEGHRTRPRIAIPQNNANKASLLDHSTLLAPTERPRATSGEDLFVEYQWILSELDSASCVATHVTVLSDLAAQLRYLGRGEDWVEASVAISEEGTVGAPSETCGERWTPTRQPGDIQLGVARSSTTDRLVRRHELAVGARERKESAQRNLSLQHYRTVCAQGLEPVAVAVFQLIPACENPDARPLSCDPENAGIWRSRVRDRAIEIAKDESYWDHPTLAVELISGHPAGRSERTEQPHMAIVPLPSINAAGTADGRVRRIALVGYSKADVREEADEIYRTLAASLDHRDLVLGGGVARLRLISTTGNDETIWRQLSQPSKRWASLTPLAIARGFTVPKRSPDGMCRLSSNERYRYKLAEWSKLVRESLRHVGLPETVISSCNIQLTQSPLYPGAQRAERYRPPGETAAFTHAHLDFSEPVRGPLLVGDRRYQGFGLFAPLI